MIKTQSCQSARVKGLDFHPHQSLLIASLHSGEINITEYGGELSSPQNNHPYLKNLPQITGPIRTVKFHPTLPILAFGCDDYHFYVWNYESNLQMAKIKHLDYVRTVEFHRTNPWLLSASDDQTTRLWNYETGKQLASYSGFHYFMCSTFNSRGDTIAGSNLDQCVYVLTIGNEKGLVSLELSQTLEGHVRGVNWVAFHPSRDDLVTASDDRHVRVWNLVNSKYVCTHILRAHSNNVSSVLFHPSENKVISVSEDKRIIIWNLTGRGRAESSIPHKDSRYWIVTSHPTENNLFAAGHDNGFEIFKTDANSISPPLKLTDNADELLSYQLNEPTVLLDSATSIFIKTLESSYDNYSLESSSLLANSAFSRNDVHEDPIIYVDEDLLLSSKIVINCKKCGKLNKPVTPICNGELSIANSICDEPVKVSFVLCNSKEGISFQCSDCSEPHSIGPCIEGARDIILCSCGDIAQREELIQTGTPQLISTSNPIPVKAKIILAIIGCLDSCINRLRRPQPNPKCGCSTLPKLKGEYAYCPYCDSVLGPYAPPTGLRKLLDKRFDTCDKCGKKFIWKRNDKSFLFLWFIILGLWLLEYMAYNGRIPIVLLTLFSIFTVVIAILEVSTWLMLKRIKPATRIIIKNRAPSREASEQV